MGAGLSGCGERSGSRVLPLLGHGRYQVGCADLMLKDGPNGDSGVFMRVFYPVDQEESPDIISEDEHPMWLPRREYLTGLANFIKMSPRKLQFFSDWVMGEKRQAARWERPLAGSKPASNVSQSFSVDDFTFVDATPQKTPARLPLSRSVQSFSTPSFPVVVFSHGLAGCRNMYSSYCSSIASYGFVVAAVEHRDLSACWTYKMIPDPLNGRMKEKGMSMKLIGPNEQEMKIRYQQLHKRVSECVKALHVLEELNMGVVSARGEKGGSSRVVVGEHFNWRQFKGRLDINRASIVGHSFGAATALAATAFSTDFQAAVCYDAWMEPIEEQMFDRFTQPTMFLNAGRWQWVKNVERMLRLDKSERSMFTFVDSTHQTFSDFAYLIKNGFIARKLGLHGETDPLMSGDAIVEMTITFLRKVLDGSSGQNAVSQLAREFPFIKEGTTLEIPKNSHL